MNGKTSSGTQEESTAERGRLLSPDAANNTGFSTRLRSPTITPSISSGLSHVTLVEDPSEVPLLGPKAALQRRHTQIIEVKISWWNCICGALFGPRFAERKAITNLKTPDCPDVETEGSDDEDPFVTTVYVLPSEEAPSKKHEAGRCTFDTGCLQGNIISKNFAQKLGFAPSEFKPLKRRERNGGISATGHIHMPEGALYLSWYHNSSPRLFSGMRFLVSPNQDFDLLIGVHSIIKHKLLLPPNFSMPQQRSAGPRPRPHTDVPLSHDRLPARAQRLKGRIDTLAEKRLVSPDLFTPEENEKLLNAQDKYNLVNNQLQLRDAKERSNAEPQNENFKAVVRALENEIRELKNLEAKKTELASAEKEFSKNQNDKNLEAQVETLQREIEQLRKGFPEAFEAAPAPPAAPAAPAPQAPKGGGSTKRQKKSGRDAR